MNYLYRRCPNCDGTRVVDGWLGDAECGTCEPVGVVPCNPHNAIMYEVLKAYPKSDPEPLTAAIITELEA